MSAPRAYYKLIFAVALTALPLLTAVAQEKVIITETDTIFFNVHPDEEEYKILAEFYKNTNGKKWTNDKNWLKGKTSEAMAKWFGIVVRDGDISEIHLPGNNLQGTIPKSLYTLRGLLAVSLEENAVENEPAKLYTTDNNRKLSAEAENMSMMNTTDQSMSLMRTSAEQTPVTGGKNLPVWGLAVNGPKVQKIDWRLTPTAAELENSGPSKNGASGVAIDDCGRLAFYVLHAGPNAPNQLHIFDEKGTQLTNTIAGDPKQGLNSANGNTEMQVVRVPGTADEWFIIYSLYQQTACSATYPSSVYCPAKVVYTRVKYNTTNGLTILPANREVSISSKTFIQGKAVSRTVNGDDKRHYLYLAERYMSGALRDVTRIHRFIIDAVGINFGTASAASIPATFWPGGISGSSVELSPDEKKLAISNRNVGSIREDIIIFDLDKFNSTTGAYSIISVPELVVSGTNKTISQLGSEPRYTCLRHIKNKLGQIEFSPSGQYLYITHGGYPSGSSGKSYDTYLLQIDLLSSTGASDPYEVRMQIQPGVNVVSGCAGPYNSIYSDNAISQIQSAHDGRLYFTKSNSSSLYVIPNPDDPLEHSLVPDDISLDDAGNIPMFGGSKVAFMPENIDGYDYLKAKTGDAAVKFTLDNSSVTPEGFVLLTITDFNAADQHQVSWGDGQTELLTSATASHQFMEKGEYTITLTVLEPAPPGEQKCAKVSSKTLSVKDCIPMESPTITVRQYRCALKFSVPKRENCFATYVWNFGDDTPVSKNRSPMHVYGTSETRTYTVTVTIHYDCAQCGEEVQASTQVTVNGIPAPAPQEITFQIPTDTRQGIIASGATTFSETWPLDHHVLNFNDVDGYVNASQGVWRNEGSFVYNTTRKAPALTSPVDLRTDGTYDIEYFNWANAGLFVIPKWVKANTMTRYNAFGFELENKDVLDIYSAALYDYGGQLQTANGVNMRNDEMAFTGFETMQTGNTAFDGKPSGNFTFDNPAIPGFKFYKVNAAQSHVGVVEATLEDLEDVDKVDILLTGYFNVYLSPFSARSRSLTDVKILCKEEHPSNSAWSVLVFERAPFDETWTGEILIRSTIVPAVRGSSDNTRAHTGKRSLKITTAQVFDQKLLHLQAGKEYHISAWVSVGNTNPMTPVPSNNIGIDVILKNKQGATVSTTYIVPGGSIIEGWQQVKGSFMCPEKDLVLSLRFKPDGPNPAWYDDLRLQPDNGNMKSYVYDITDFRLKAILDEDNFASMFYYDKEGNLHLTKKETTEGIKTITENVSYQVERPSGQ